MYQQPYVPQYNSYGYSTQPGLPQRPPAYTDMQRQGGTPMLKGRPVTSLEEARASMIDFDGSVFYFPDPSSRRIYTKHINLDGTATLCTYEYVEAPVAAAAVAAMDGSSYVSQEEFQNTINLVLGEIEKMKVEEKKDNE